MMVKMCLSIKTELKAGKKRLFTVFLYGHFFSLTG